jgi:hypothetical protein
MSCASTASKPSSRFCRYSRSGNPSRVKEEGVAVAHATQAKRHSSIHVCRRAGFAGSALWRRTAPRLSPSLHSTMLERGLLAPPKHRHGPAETCPGVHLQTVAEMQQASHGVATITKRTRGKVSHDRSPVSTRTHGRSLL